MSARDKLFRIYFWLQRIVVPGLRYSQDIYEEVLVSMVNSSTTWLDLGCGHEILPEWRWDAEQLLVRGCRTIVGIDYDFPSLRKHKSIQMRVRGDITRLPFKDDAFDLITANMVLEHVHRPDLLFSEVSRVLRKGGVFAFHTPNRAGYNTAVARILPQRAKHMLTGLLQGRGESDVFETYYLVNDPARISALANNTHFALERLRLINSSAELAVIAPLALIELLWIKLLMTKSFKPLRTNIICSLRNMK